ncbi:trichodiene oxygenase [Nemania sp. FL0916]|nr:trichodiene oxygenase [Nemania sp. FL0916]
MEFFFNARMLLLAVGIYYGTLVFYRLFLHPLARFPGPRLAAVSRWYEAYYDVVRGGQYTKKIAKLHQTYGPIIRISPHELHVADASFFETLYRTDGRWHKYSWTYDAFGFKKSTVFSSDHDAHKARRRAIVPMFLKTNIVSRIQIVLRNVDKVRQRVSARSNDIIDLGAAISAFTRDITNEFVIGKAYDELSLDDFGVELSISSSGAGPFWHTTKHIPWFGPALRAIPISWVMKIADGGTQAFLRHLMQTEQDTREVMNTNSEVGDTMIDGILRSNLPAEEKSFDRIYQEVATVTGAGYETTANALRLVFYHVYADRNILRRLREELASVANKENAHTLSTLERLPYLTSVLKEGLRLSPGIATRAARITDRDVFYSNWCIPAGTPIGMTTILMHTDEKLYPDPLSFRPDRWLDSTAQERASVPFAPFSRGTRMCLGMHLAWAEMYLLLSSLVQAFDFTFEKAQPSDFELEKDNFGIGTKAKCHLLARVTPRSE